MQEVKYYPKLGGPSKLSDNIYSDKANNPLSTPKG